MARTLNPEIHAGRRDAFVDGATRLIQLKGYEQMSIGDVLAELEASRGAFYHYFDSKAALLDAVVERLADQATVRVEPILADPELPAIAKLEAMFSGLAQFKAERKELVLGILQVWLSDDNAIVREKMRRLVTARLVPWLERIVRQGIDEGAFSSAHPAHLARILASLILAMSDLASELWVARQHGSVPFEDVVATFDAYREAFERIVGVRPGSIRFLDEPTLRIWFG